MRRICSIASVIGLLCLLGVPALGAPIPITNTGAGVAPGGVDPNWTLQLIYQAFVPTGSPGSFPYTAWLANDGTSQWIAPRSSYTTTTDDTAGNWTFETTFDLTGLEPSTAQIQGRWLADNYGFDIYLNGVILMPHRLTLVSDFQHWSAFDIPVGSPFQAGVNTLDFIVDNFAGTPGNPVGLRVEFLSATASPIPEPATFALLGAGLLGLGIIYRRKKKSA